MLGLKALFLDDFEIASSVWYLSKASFNRLYSYSLIVI